MFIWLNAQEAHGMRYFLALPWFPQQRADEKKLSKKNKWMILEDHKYFIDKLHLKDK